MTTQRARDILGKKYAKRTDEEIQAILVLLTRIVNKAIDSVLEMTPEERKKHDKKLSI